MKKLIATVVLTLLSGTALAGTITDVSKINALEQGKTTVAEAQAILGSPEHEDHNPDGRSVYLYNFELPDHSAPQSPPTKGIVAFLFAADGTFQRLSMYKNTGP